MTLLVLIIIHIIAGAIAILSGFAALSVTKSASAHRSFGKVFVLAILFLGFTGIYIALSRSIMLSFINGILLCYFVSTAWMTVKRPAGTIGQFEWIAFLVALSIVAMLISFAGVAADSTDGKLNGFGPQVFYFFAVVATVAALFDLKMILKRGISGTQRIVRHIWRMCFPLFMSTAAFFLGQAKLMPEPMRKIEILAIPVVVVLLAMVYWIVKVLYTKAYQVNQNLSH